MSLHMSNILAGLWHRVGGVSTAVYDSDGDHCASGRLSSGG